MHSEQTAFLISCGPDGSIIRPYWYQPIYLLSPYHKNMTDLFSENDALFLNELIAHARKEKDLFLCPRQLELKQSGIEVSLCLISAGKSVLIMGLDTSIIRDPSDISVLQTISHHFMRSIGSFESSFATGSDELVRMQFEQIQKSNRSGRTFETSCCESLSMWGKRKRKSPAAQEWLYTGRIPEKS
ncbi:MAG: hypothetical protein PHW61_01580, partial [Eubacteriales bacterium]|nr:hypothetical protein [Eubacteriales bacterium]